MSGTTGVETTVDGNEEREKERRVRSGSINALDTRTTDRNVLTDNLSTPETACGSQTEWGRGRRPKTGSSKTCSHTESWEGRRKDREVRSIPKRANEYTVRFFAVGRVGTESDKEERDRQLLYNVVAIGNIYMSQR